MSEHMREPADADPAEEDLGQDEGTLPLITTAEYYDLLMEQQEQM